MTVSLDEICRLIGLQLGRKGVRGEDHIVGDLGAESIDILNIVATIEEKYRVVFEEEELARMERISDLHSLTLRKMQG